MSFNAWWCAWVAVWPETDASRETSQLELGVHLLALPRETLGEKLNHGSSPQAQRQHHPAFFCSSYTLEEEESSLAACFWREDKFFFVPVWKDASRCLVRRRTDPDLPNRFPPGFISGGLKQVTRRGGGGGGGGLCGCVVGPTTNFILVNCSRFYCKLALKSWRWDAWRCRVNRRDFDHFENTTLTTPWSSETWNTFIVLFVVLNR